MAQAIDMQGIPPMDSSVLQGQPNFAPPQQTDPNSGLLRQILTQYAQDKQQSNQGQGLIQQILSNRLQPEGQDVARSITQTAQSYGAPDQFKAATPDQALDERVTSQLAPYTTMLGLQAKMANAKNRGGATGELIDRLMQENPAMSFQQALQRVQTGFRQNMILDDTGSIQNLPGSVAAAANMAGGKQNAVKGVDLNYAAPIASATETGRTTAENTVKNQVQLPQLVDNAAFLNQKVDELVNHPALSSSTGISSYLPVIRGTQRADFMTRLSQIQSDTFLQAFQTLRGGGSISNAEGEKATGALNRMTQATSTEDFKSAANDFKTIVNQAVVRARNASQGQPMAATQSAPQQAAPDPLGIR